MNIESDKKCFVIEYSEPAEQKNNASQISLFSAPYPILSNEEREKRIKFASTIPRPNAQPRDYKSTCQSTLKTNNNNEQLVDDAMKYLIFTLGLRNHHIPQFVTIKDEVDLFGKPICMFNALEKKYFEEWMEELERTFERFSRCGEVSFE